MVVIWQFNGINEVDDLVRCDAWPAHCLHLRAQHLVEAHDLVGTVDVANCAKCGERHHVAFVVGHKQLVYVAQGAPVFRRRLYLHLVVLVVQGEVVDVQRRQVVLQCSEYAGHIDAQCLRLFPVDVKVQLRQIRIVGTQCEHGER